MRRPRSSETAVAWMGCPLPSSMEPAIPRVGRCPAQRAPLGVRLCRRTASNPGRGNRACHRELPTEKNEEWSYRFGYHMTRMLPTELARDFCSLEEKSTFLDIKRMAASLILVFDQGFLAPGAQRSLPRFKSGKNFQREFAVRQGGAGKLNAF
jgi:hypothetical protein